MNQADAACYVAKDAGRNRVAIYDPAQARPGTFRPDRLKLFR